MYNAGVVPFWFSKLLWNDILISILFAICEGLNIYLMFEVILLRTGLF